MAQLLTGTRIYGTGTVDTQLFVSGTNSATSTTTGALQVVGGVGVGGNLYVGGTIFGSIISGTASTATNADNVKTVSQTTNASYYPAFVDSNNSTAAYEALYTTSSFVINPQSGNVGVGESDPLRKFVVRSDSSGSITAIGIYNGSTATSNGSVISFRSDTTGTGATTFQEFAGFSTTYTDKNHATRSGDFNIFTANSGTVATRLVVKSTGNVGIGFTAPNGKLDVAGDLYVGATQNTARFKSDGTDTFVDAIPGAGAVVIRAGGSVEKLRVTANGGISFGASGTAYGTSGQILQSNGDAAPTWISTGSLAAANATTATHLSGGVAGQIPYQTAPGVTAFLSTGTAGDVLVSNGSSAATYNNTLRLAGSTNATSTTSGALQVVGGVGVGGDLFIHGDIRTNDTLFNLINANATTVNFAGDATTLTMGASGSGTTNVRNNLTVSGNLTVQGTTTIVDSTVTNIADPIITLGGGTGDTAPTADDNKDRGVAFKWVNNGGTTSTGFFGYDDSTGHFTYVQTATITNEVVSGTKGAMDVNLAGGTAMSIVYQSSPNNTAFLAASTSGYILQTNGTGVAPTWVSASGVSAGSATYADQIRTLAQTASATYYPTFVDSNNASNAYELVYTTSSFSINPATGAVSISGLLTVSASSGAGGIAVGSNADRAQYQYINFGGSVGGTDYAWQVGRSPSGGVGPADGFYIYDIKGSSTRVSIDGSGNVGIGTITPRVKLSLLGAATGVVELANLHNTGILNGDGSSLTFSGYLAPSAYPTWRFAGIKGVYDTTSSGLNSGNWGGQLRLFVNRGGAADQFEDVVTITGGGNVGIGTNAPLAKLHIEGNSLILNTEGSAQAKLLYFRYSNGATVQSDSYLVFGTGGSPQERMRITSNGGIAFSGTNTYGTSGFVLKSNGDAAPTWVDPSTLASAGATNADNIRTVAQTANASYFPTFVDSNNASNAYELVYTTSSFSINPATGRVGIGTSSPSTNLTIGGTAASGGAGGGLGAFLSRGVTTNFYEAFDGTKSYIAGVDDTQSFAKAGTLSGHDLAIITGNGSKIYIQNSTGNVGIGTSTPQTTLDVRSYTTSNTTVNNGVTLWNPSGVNDTPIGIRLSTYGDETGNQYPKQFIGAIRDGAFGAGKGNIVFCNRNAADTSVVTLSDEKLRITASGGISFGASGTAYGTSGQVLQSNGDAPPTWINQSSITSGATSLTNTYVGYGSASNLLTGSSNVTWNGTAFYVNGNVGVQVGSPISKLQVGSHTFSGVHGVYSNARSGLSVNGSLTSIVYASTYNDATYPDYGMVFVHGPTTSNYNVWSISPDGPAKGSGLGFIYGANADNIHVGAPKVYFQGSTGNVGIGTSTPNRKLHVQSSGAAIQLWDASTNGGAGIFFAGASTLKNWFIGNQYNISDVLEFTPSAAVGTTTIGTTPVMVIQSGGNVGIGTTNPPNKLTVSNGGAVGLEISPTGAYTGLGGVDLLAYNRSTSAYAPIGFVTNGSNNSMVILTSGNVGIGTSTPNDKLQVVTSSATAYDATTDTGQYGGGAGITVTNMDETSQSFAQINLQVSGASGRAVGRIVAIRTASATSDLAFVTENANTKAEKMRIFSNGNVSIGTTSTTNKFEVAGAAGQLFSVSDSFTGTIFSANDVSGIPSIEVLDTGLVKLAQYNGAVTIGTGTVSSSTAELSVYGMLYTSGAQGEIRASSEITAYFSSDRRLKENIKLIENPITIIDQIRGVTFDWTDEHMARRGGEDGYFVRKHDIGVIAQEVQAVLPELVGTREDGYLAVKYEKMVPLLIEAIKSQQKTIDTLTSEIKEIKEFLSSLKNN